MSASAKVLGWAKGSTAALAAVLPRVLVGGLKGGAVGAVGMGVLGAALAAASAQWWHARGAELPSWLYASLVAVPVLWAVAGGFVGTVRGLLSALGQALLDQGLVRWVYAQVKPAAASVVRAAQGRIPARAGEVAAMLKAQLDAQEERGGAEPGRLDAVTHWLAMRSRRVLALSVIGHVARAPSGAQAIAELEKLGIARLEQVLLDSLGDLFAVKVTLVAGATMLLSVAPQVVYALAG